MQFVKSVYVGLHRYLYLLEIINIYTIKWMCYNVCKLYLKVDIKRKLNMYKFSFEMNAFLFQWDRHMKGNLRVCGNLASYISY